MHYAVEGHTILELRAQCLPMNALYRIVEIGCTVSEIRADYLHLAGKKVYSFDGAASACAADSCEFPMIFL